MIDETDEALIESLATNFLSSQTAGLDEAEKMGQWAYKYVIALGHAKGWKSRTREQMARRVQRRVEWRLTQNQRGLSQE
jgi:hypothetical protein